MTPYVVAFVTAPNSEVALPMARTLVEEGLAACVNIVPSVRSVYRWQGEICDDAEVLLLLKTRQDRFEALRSRVAALHPYEVPEIIAVPIVEGHMPYLAWLESSLACE